MSPDLADKTRTAMRGARNFFKHAEKDPDGVHPFNPEETVFLIFEAVTAAKTLVGKHTPERNVYTTWFIRRYPEIADRDNTDPELLKGIQSLPLNDSDRKWFAGFIRRQKLPS